MEINCFVCGETYITNEAIENVAIEVDYNTFVYICPDCRERILKEVSDDA